jgi:GNAT superfamily N-acetyltransferase
MLYVRLDETNINELLDFCEGKYPLTREVACDICIGAHPVSPCTQVYGAFCNENGESELVAIMTATYCIVFPHRDGTRIVHVSGAYTKDNFRHRGYASALLETIERDARTYFHADYICCDSVADSLYEKHGLQKASETRLWKQLV